MASETELKLEFDAAGADALEQSGLHRRAGTTSRQVSHYFDTPDLLLRQAGLSLRIRSSGGRLVQTVKATGSGLLTRGEWEIEVAGITPQPDARTPLAAVLGRRMTRLTEMFMIEVERKAWPVPTVRNEIELVIDRGELRCGPRRERFFEAELELLRGEPAGLFKMARGIDRVTPVRLGVRSKADRGFALREAMQSAFRAGKIRLDPDLSPATAFAAVARDCLQQYRLNETILLNGPGPDAVHQARVALRRLRSAHTVFRGALPTVERKAFQQRLRKASSGLADARDLDVLLGRCAASPLAAPVERARNAAYSRLGAQLHREEARRWPFDLLAWTETIAKDGDWTGHSDSAQPLDGFAASALDRLHRRVCRQAESFEALSIEQKHMFRKDAKKLRYAIDFLGTVFTSPKAITRRKAYVRTLASLQEHLGGLNDRHAAEQLLIRFDLRQSAGAEALLDEWETGDMQAEAAQSCTELLDAKPFWRSHR